MAAANGSRACVALQAGAFRACFCECGRMANLGAELLRPLLAEQRGRAHVEPAVPAARHAQSSGARRRDRRGSGRRFDARAAEAQEREDVKAALAAPSPASANRSRYCFVCRRSKRRLAVRRCILGEDRERLR